MVLEDIAAEASPEEAMSPRMAVPGKNQDITGLRRLPAGKKTGPLMVAVATGDKKAKMSILDTVIVLILVTEEATKPRVEVGMMILSMVDAVLMEGLTSLPTVEASNKVATKKPDVGAQEIVAVMNILPNLARLNTVVLQLTVGIANVHLTAAMGRKKHLTRLLTRLLAVSVIPVTVNPHMVAVERKKVRTRRLTVRLVGKNTDGRKDMEAPVDMRLLTASLLLKTIRLSSIQVVNKGVEMIRTPNSTTPADMDTPVNARMAVKRNIAIIEGVKTTSMVQEKRLELSD